MPNRQDRRGLKRLMRAVPPPVMVQDIHEILAPKDPKSGHETVGHIVMDRAVGGPYYAINFHREITKDAPWFMAGGSVLAMLWGRRMSRVEALASAMKGIEAELNKVEPGALDKKLLPVFLNINDLVQKALEQLELASIPPDHPKFPKLVQEEASRIEEVKPVLVTPEGQAIAPTPISEQMSAEPQKSDEERAAEAEAWF